MESPSTTSAGLTLDPLNYTQYLQSMKNQFADTNAEYLCVFNGQPYQMPQAPSLADKILDLSTQLPTNRDMFPATDAGNKAYVDACNTYKKELKELKAIFGKMMKVTLMSISEPSESIMKAYGDFEKAKENIADLWKLLRDSHQSTSDREIHNQLSRFINCKQNDSNFLTYLAVFNKVALEVQECIPNFINLTSTELMDIFKKVLLMNGIDKIFFKQVLDNELDSNSAHSFTEVQKRLTQFLRNSTDSSLTPFNSAGYGAKIQHSPQVSKVPIQCECYKCHKMFPYVISAITGLPFQLCKLCADERSVLRRNSSKNEKAVKNHTLSEIQAIQDAQKKVAAAEVESKLAAKKAAPPKPSAPAKKPAILPAKKGKTVISTDDADEFGVESDDSY